MESTTQMLTILSKEKKITPSLTVSEEAGKTGDVIMQLIIDCITNAHKKIQLCSSLPGFEKNAEQLDNARKRVNEFLMQKIEGLSQINERQLLILFNRAIEAQRAGNCFEFAFYTKSLLEKRGVSTEVLRVTKPETKDSHVFLVVKANDGTSGLSYPEGIIIDPFMQKVFCVKEIDIYLEVCVFDEKTATVSYVPYESNKHVLDDRVQAELLEDWQSVIHIRDARLRRDTPSSGADEAESTFKP